MAADLLPPYYKKQRVTMSKAEAEEFKAQGNAALQAGKLTEAIENYTKAIDADGTNHVYYSNRSAAYLKKGDGNNALEDANSTIAINPEFRKGYSRKGGELQVVYILQCLHLMHIFFLQCSYTLSSNLVNYIHPNTIFSRTARIETL